MIAPYIFSNPVGWSNREKGNEMEINLNNREMDLCQQAVDAVNRLNKCWLIVKGMDCDMALGLCCMLAERISKADGRDIREVADYLREAILAVNDERGEQEG